MRATALLALGNRRRKEKGGPSRTALSLPLASDQVRLPATLLMTLEIDLPTLVMAVIAATAISEAISAYSIALAPRSFFIRRRKMDSICISKRKDVCETSALAARHRFWGSAGAVDANAGAAMHPYLNK